MSEQPTNLRADPHFLLAAEHFGYVADAVLAETDREVLALADFLRTKFGSWTVKASDHDRVRDAALALRNACKDRLPTGDYLNLKSECLEVDAALSVGYAAVKHCASPSPKV